MNDTQETRSDDLIVDVKNNIAFLTLNRPQALNALTLEMLKTMRALFDEWARDPNIFAVVSRGAGGKAYCAGGDVRGLYASALAQANSSGATMHQEFFEVEYTLNYQMHRILKATGKPYIAMMNGVVMGGGMGISQGASLRIVGEHTKMAMPETKIGLFPDVGGTYFLSRATNATGLYLGLTSNVIDGADACFAKLADLYMTRSAEENFLRALETHTWSANKLNDIVSLAKQHAQTPPASKLAAHDSLIQKHFSNKPNVQSIITSLQNETQCEHKEWAQKISHDLSQRSPTMLEVTKRQIENGHRMSLADGLRLESNMMAAVFEHPDIVEGIRALVIDKDNQPNWNPATLAGVTRESVDRFFAPRWTKEQHPLRDLEKKFG
jgi:enoyl-CoA hydratase/carnithine racemase